MNQSISGYLKKHRDMVVLTTAGAAFTYLRSIPYVAVRQIKNQLFVSATISEYDPLYHRFQKWLMAQEYSQKAKNVTVSSREIVDPSTGWDDNPRSPSILDALLAKRRSGSRRGSNIEVNFIPAEGSHFFIFEGKPLWISRDRSYTTNTDRSKGGMGECYTLRMLGTDTTPLREFFERISDEYAEEQIEERKIEIRNGSNGYWNYAGHIRPRRIESVILPEGQREHLVEDVTDFFSNRSWYDDLGIPYRRGYLLHGIPGTGKSSIVSAIAGQFGLPIYMVNLGAKGLSDGHLVEMLGDVPQFGIVLLEDADALFSHRNKTNENESDISFSGLLNAIDGISASEGRLLFVTTNYLDRLDSALIRPGRVDYRLEFHYADAYQGATLYSRFFRDSTEEQAQAFGRHIGEREWSMAQVQEHLMHHRYDPVQAIDSLFIQRVAEQLTA